MAAQRTPTVSRLRRDGPSRPREEEDERPAREQGHVDKPGAVDDEPTRVDAERPLDRLEDLADTPMRWGRQAFPAGSRRGTGLVGGTMAHA